jgi:hypothetical protein
VLLSGGTEGIHEQIQESEIFVERLTARQDVLDQLRHIQERVGWVGWTSQLFCQTPQVGETVKDTWDTQVFGRECSVLSTERLRELCFQKHGGKIPVPKDDVDIGTGGEATRDDQLGLEVNGRGIEREFQGGEDGIEITQRSPIVEAVHA